METKAVAQESGEESTGAGTNEKPIVIDDDSLKNTTIVKIEPQTQRSDISTNDALQQAAGSLANQLCPLGPKDRCTPSQAQAMGQQVLSLMVMHENNKLELPHELQNTFDIFHRCLAVAYGTFFLHLYTKANAPCLLCHGCKSLYPPGQYIHHACPALPPNIVPCRSRMWRRCLVPLVSSDIDKTQQKERWKYVLEKFSHSNMGVVRRSRLPLETETNLLDMPECKRGRFVRSPTENLIQLKTSVTLPCSTDLSGGSYEEAHCYYQDDDEDVQNYSTSDDIHTVVTKSISIPENKPEYRALELIEQLLKETRRLGEELVLTKKSLENAERRLSGMNGKLSEQLEQSFLVQDKLRAERDLALKKASEAEHKVEILENHFKKMQKLQNEALSLAHSD